MAHKYQNTKALLRIHEYFDKIKLEMTNDEIMNYKFGINKQLNTKVILERLKKYPIEVQQTSSVVTINDKVDWKVVKEIIFEKNEHTPIDLYYLGICYENEKNICNMNTYYVKAFKEGYTHALNALFEYCINTNNYCEFKHYFSVACDKGFFSMALDYVHKYFNNGEYEKHFRKSIKNATENIPIDLLGSIYSDKTFKESLDKTFKKSLEQIDKLNIGELGDMLSDIIGVNNKGMNNEMTKLITSVVDNLKESKIDDTDTFFVDIAKKVKKSEMEFIEVQLTKSEFINNTKTIFNRLENEEFMDDYDKQIMDIIADNNIDHKFIKDILTIKTDKNPQEIAYLRALDKQ